MPNAETRDVEAEVYHADGPNSLSHSEAEIFYRDPAEYYGLCVARSFERTVSDAFNFGQGTHTTVLLPGRVDKEVKIVPADVLGKNGAKNTKAYREWAEEHKGFCCLTEAQYATLDAIHTALYSNTAAAEILSAPDALLEHSIWWDDAVFPDVRRRARLDGLLPECIFDLKTIEHTPADYRAVEAAIERFAYYRQAAWYQDGVADLYAINPPFVLIFVQKRPPYTVVVAELPDGWIQRGRHENLDIMADYRRCRETGKWNYKDQGRVVRLEEPAYAARHNPYSDSGETE